MTTFLVVVVTVFVYLFIAGLVQKNFKPWRVRVCNGCNGRGGRCEGDHAAAAFFAGILWPFALPMSLGIYGTAILGMGHGGKSRAERRREEEIAEAKHRQQLARIKADETAELERAAL